MRTKTIKTQLLISFLLINLVFLKAQSCQETLNFVKSKGYGSSYYSPSSRTISKVTFYDVSINYTSQYFATVSFKSNPYKEYIYLVGSNTQSNYTRNYLNSAGGAFWKFIAPYNKNLGCAPNFD